MNARTSLLKLCKISHLLLKVEYFISDPINPINSTLDGIEAETFLKTFYVKSSNNSTIPGKICNIDNIALTHSSQLILLHKGFLIQFYKHKTFLPLQSDKLGEVVDRN